MANLWISLVFLPVMAVIAGSHLYTVYTYRRFRDHPAVCGLTGTQVARLLLDKVGLSQVEVKEVQGLLADGYDITSSTIRLSSENFRSTSVAAAGIAAHEVGHVLQAYHTDQHPGFTLLNPLTWLDTMLNAVEHMNFFEGRATEYSKASTQGTWTEAFS